MLQRAQTLVRHPAFMQGVRDLAPQAPGTVRRPPPRLDEHGARIRAAGWGAFAAP